MGLTNFTRLLTIRQFAEIVGRHPVTIKKRCLAGLIPGAFKEGPRGDWRIPETALPAAAAPVPEPPPPVSRRAERAQVARDMEFIRTGKRSR